MYHFVLFGGNKQIQGPQIGCFLSGAFDAAAAALFDRPRLINFLIVRLVQWRCAWDTNNQTDEQKKIQISTYH
ncbi:hypothetical protein DERF_012574 [Dermatophagoides farinae]|uniref:Uncharacterized protein n=1 Tax=Dermatophagoides farinae TaxID=6954 RepID=A0A922L0D0_DERFA|nr:hypothetical protein DERF_012574 [Dermatophagoides farinae]